MQGVPTPEHVDPFESTLPALLRNAMELAYEYGRKAGAYQAGGRSGMAEIIKREAHARIQFEIRKLARTGRILDKILADSDAEPPLTVPQAWVDEFGG